MVLLYAKVLAPIIKKVGKNAKIRNRYNQAPRLTKDTTWESDKNTSKHHTQDSQVVSHFSAGEHKATINRQENMTNRNINNEKDPQKKHHMRSAKYFYWRA